MSTQWLAQNNIFHKGSVLARRDFLKYSMGTFSYIYLTGCSSNSNTPEIKNYPIASSVFTTKDKTIVPSATYGTVIEPKNLKNIAQYDASGYGVWEDGGPLEVVERYDLDPSYILPADKKSKKLSRFFAITDIHITDKESPSQLLHLQPLNEVGDILHRDFESTVTSIYSPTMLYSTHTLDAIVQTVNALHEQESVDFGISLGDASNSTQYNETRWYIDILDGGIITPSSGANLGAKTIDFQKPYKALGLNKKIPWYQAIGNHDHFWMGSIPLDDPQNQINLRASYVDDKVIAMPNTLRYADNVYTRDGKQLFYMGVLDGADPYGDIIKDGPIEDFASAPTVVPDVKRRSLTKLEWTQEFFNTTSEPKGHGFHLVPEGKDPDFGCYSFKPKSDIPLKVIVLDNTQREDDKDPGIHGRGFLDQERWDWLKEELQAGTDNDELMIIACHVPIAVMPYKAADPDGEQKDTFMDWYQNTRGGTIENAVTLEGLINELHSHSNLLMWMAGHRHVNTIKAFVSDDDTKPERGFWQVETSSLHDFPQQMRMFDIHLNSDYTISIDAINVDAAVKEGTPAYKGLKYAVAARQIINLKDNISQINPWADPRYNNDTYKGVDPTVKPVDQGSGSYNAKLILKLSTKMQIKLQTLFPTI